MRAAVFLLWRSWWSVPVECLLRVPVCWISAVSLPVRAATAWMGRRSAAAWFLQLLLCARLIPMLLFLSIPIVRIRRRQLLLPVLILSTISVRWRLTRAWRMWLWLLKRRLSLCICAVRRRICSRTASTRMLCRRLPFIWRRGRSFCVSAV